MESFDGLITFATPSTSNISNDEGFRWMEKGTL